MNENPLITEMRETIRNNPGVSVSIHLHDADGVPNFCVVIGGRSSFGATIREAVSNSGDSVAKRIAFLRQEATALGITISEKAA